MKKLIALLLALVMCLAVFTACEEEQTETRRRMKREHATTEPDVSEAEDILTFRLEDSDVDLYYEKLEELEEVALAGEDRETIETLVYELEDLDMFLGDQLTIAEILHYCDTKDEDASNRYLEMTEVVTELGEANIETMRRIYNSDSPFKDFIFEGWTEDDIAYMLGYDTEVKEITQRGEEILVEYRELTDSQKETKAGKMYAELASNNNRIAQLYGYDNYYEYSYEVLCQRDYSAEEVAQLRNYAQTYIPMLFEAAVERYRESYYELSARQQKELDAFMLDDYDDSDYLQNYLDALPEDMSADMQSMFDGNSIFPKTSKAREGAFTTLIGGYPYCYFSKDYKTADTIVHEMGHYYSALHGDLSTVPLDLAEVQSQGNEWLMIVYAGQTMDEEVYECYLNYRFANDLVTILISVVIDEFEQQVYSSKNLAEFDTEDFERIMTAVCENYGGEEYLETYMADMQYYWRAVVLESPVYYISYAVSMVPSLDIFFCASEDWDEALEIYQAVTLDIELEDTFLGVLDEAGLATPFEDDLFMKLVEHYDLFVSDSFVKAEEKAA